MATEGTADAAAGRRRQVRRGRRADTPAGQAGAGHAQPGLGVGAAPSAAAPQSGDVAWLTIRGARHNNLKDVTAGFPLARFTCVTGVSGSGKSSLVNDVLHAALARELNGAQTTPGEFERIEVVGGQAGSAGRAAAREPRRNGDGQPGDAVRGGALRAGDIAASLHAALDKIIAIDQTPIGRTPRSNPATYIKVFDEIRDLFTRLPDAKLRGYKPGRFSFNVAAGRRGGGRCEACEGNGANRIEMDFLADVWVTCPVCSGRRFTRETLAVQYKGKSIADVLEMDVAEALEHFEPVPRIRAMLQTLHDVGLDYIKLGQASTTLSGGEAQRIKLARELVKKPTGRTLYVLDEPTTGLHFEDIRKLLAVLHGFVDAGNTVIVIEHNLDVIKTADWVIDLGPEGGAGGGRIVAAGTPEQVAAVTGSHTGEALRGVLSSACRVQGHEWQKPVGVDSELAAQNATLDTPAVFVRGARENNLKDVSVAFPREQMTVCTGVSGSGKTSFAIDTVFVEGYRRYVESLSAYARQFLGQMAKPRVEHVEGLSPAICIEQKAASKSPRSTVGTVTEIYDYMRVLWARLGTPYCPRCQTPIGAQAVDEIVDRVMALGRGVPIILLAPVRLSEGETYAGLFNRLKRSGYTRVRINGEITLAAQATTLDARRRHRVEVVVDRTVVKPAARGRIAESVEHALALGNGLMTVVVEEQHRDNGDDAAKVRGEAVETPDAAASPLRHTVAPSHPSELRFSQKLACLTCGESYEELSPHHFSFNSQMGWCETCEGLGVQRGAPAGDIIRNPRRSLFDGAIAGWTRIDRRTPMGRMLVALCAHLGVSPDAPLEDWTTAQRSALLFGPQIGRAAASWIDAPDLLGGPGNTKNRQADNAGLRFQWRGLFPALDSAMRHSWTLRHRLNELVTDIPCLTCRGGRLRPDAAAVRLEVSSERRAPSDPLKTTSGRSSGGQIPSELVTLHSPPAASNSPLVTPSVVELCQRPLGEALAYFDGLRLDARQQRIAGEVVLEIRRRLRFLVDVGLEYLTLDRAAPTLSGGEAQRIRLASQIGSGLSGVLYVLDEPTIGLHPRDTARLVAALRKLRALGNTLLLVEHDREVIAAADHLLDFGPRAGKHGGEIVAQGTPGRLVSERALPPATAGGEGPQPRSLTRGYLTGELAVPIPSNRRPVRAGAEPAAWLMIRGARQNNLKNIDVPVPLGRLVCVTGVSGSGKSSLINDILWPGLSRAINQANVTVGEHDRIEVIEEGTQRRRDEETKKSGRSEARARRSPPTPPLRRSVNPSLTRHIDKVINVDQSPIGLTPASNPVTYTGAFDWIRELFARLPESKLRGWQANRFSFNRPGGRCEACEGQGQKRIEMHFMPDVWVTCETCGGRRYTAETLEVRFKERSIADVLDMRVADALELFDSVPKVRRLLQTLADVGLDYVQLGQPAPTLSGGEAQRVKLAAELGKPDTGRTLYVLDEPTTGLHFDDVRKLLGVLHRLVDLGNTVVVVEHNLDVLKNADWIIDLGPQAGEAGGRIVALGTPEEIASSKSRLAKQHADRRPVSEFAVHRSPFAAPSHTAAALAPVLAAGPYEPRAPYDPAEHARREIEVEKQRFGGVGKGVKMPWQIDGRRWHLEQRPTRGGGAVRWEAAALLYIEQLVQQVGKGRFSPTNWNERASIEVTAPGADTWFLHILTGGEWLLELYFLVPRGTFRQPDLDRQLGLKTLDERDDLQTYGDWSRVDVRPRQGGIDAVAVYVHDRAEIDTPGFRRFVRDAGAAYFSMVGARASPSQSE
ncbi:MAG: ATP-binding cassette domain-containing protein [Phycisphaerae bacterium]|nr:ATP-binding cassette domain-containing protein [Phycisphaerae bacterium]